MHMRIVWGKILPGQWEAFEAAYNKALEIRGEVRGLKHQPVYPLSSADLAWQILPKLSEGGRCHGA